MPWSEDVHKMAANLILRFWIEIGGFSIKEDGKELAKLWYIHVQAEKKRYWVQRVTTDAGIHR